MSITAPAALAQDTALATDLAQAMQGNAVAQTAMGQRYHTGDGVPRDDARAVEWFQRAAEQEDALGQFRLGRMYYYGHGVDQDAAKCYENILAAAEQGLGVAQASLGYLYLHGYCVETDLPAAADWLRRSSAQGFASSRFELGKLLRRDPTLAAHDGEGLALLTELIAQDHQEALDYLIADHIAKGEMQDAAQLQAKKAAAGDAQAGAWLTANGFQKDGSEAPQTPALSGWEARKKYAEALAIWTSENGKRDAAQVLKIADPAAHSGNADAIALILEVFESTELLEGREDEALAWAERAEKMGLPEGVNFKITYLLDKKQSTPQNRVRAESLLQKLFDYNDVRFQRDVETYAKWIGQDPSDWHRSPSWYRDIAAKGNVLADFQLGANFADAGYYGTEDYYAAMCQLFKAVRSDKPDVKDWVDSIDRYLTDNEPKDVPAPSEEARISCAELDAISPNQKVAYAKGAQDRFLELEAQADKDHQALYRFWVLRKGWLRSAAWDGHNEAMWQFGQLLADPFTGRRQSELAYAWLSRVDLTGQPERQFEFAQQIGESFNGDLGMSDEEVQKAIAPLIQAAAEAGHTPAFGNYAAFLALGLGGIPKDLEAAQIWAKEALDSGDERAAGLLEFIESQ
jgi:TPR repeat protein